MANNIVGASPELEDEIRLGLEALKKNGYEASVQESGNALAIVFRLGETEQTIKFKDGDWRKKDVVSKIIVDKLSI